MKTTCKNLCADKEKIINGDKRKVIVFERKRSDVIDSTCPFGKALCYWA